MTPSLEFAMNNGLSARQAVMIELVVAGDEAALRAMLEPVVVGCDDGWVEWNGGNNPVESSVMVDVRFKSGAIVRSTSAGLFIWSYTDSRVDITERIVAYRILP